MPSTSQALLEELSPLPNSSNANFTARKRRGAHGKILTSTPYKAQLEEKRSDLQSGDKKKVVNKGIKRKKEGKPVGKSASMIKKVLKFNENNGQVNCIIFGVHFDEDWIQCNVCKGWAHENCANLESVPLFYKRDRHSNLVERGSTEAIQKSQDARFEIPLHQNNIRNSNHHWPSEMVYYLHACMTANKERKLSDMCIARCVAATADVVAYCAPAQVSSVFSRGSGRLFLLDGDSFLVDALVAPLATYSCCGVVRCYRLFAMSVTPRFKWDARRQLHPSLYRYSQSATSLSRPLVALPAPKSEWKVVPSSFCGHCPNSVKALLGRIPGVEEEGVVAESAQVANSEDQRVAAVAIFRREAEITAEGSSFVSDVRQQVSYLPKLPTCRHGNQRLKAPPQLKLFRWSDPEGSAHPETRRERQGNNQNILAKINLRNSILPRMGAQGARQSYLACMVAHLCKSPCVPRVTARKVLTRSFARLSGKRCGAGSNDKYTAAPSCPPIMCLATTALEGSCKSHCFPPCRMLILEHYNVLQHFDASRLCKECFNPRDLTSLFQADTGVVSASLHTMCRNGKTFKGTGRSEILMENPMLRPYWMKSREYWDANFEERYKARKQKWPELPLKGFPSKFGAFAASRTTCPESSGVADGCSVRARLESLFPGSAHRVERHASTRRDDPVAGATLSDVIPTAFYPARDARVLVHAPPRENATHVVSHAGILLDKRIDGRQIVVSRFQLTDEKTDGRLTVGLRRMVVSPA
ncbi:hypothetical protein PR048_008439 [Dryococelus australis]|uniref:Uncharacterized protein n=1 Tax=Dryococelus australis TaxID=614101 RepID=A0ABQ9HX39_9NEOP|nr:hypothetical protein PR048_008439 [Dryococelus australis]